MGKRGQAKADAFSLACYEALTRLGGLASAKQIADAMNGPCREVEVRRWCVKLVNQRALSRKKVKATWFYSTTPIE